MKKTLVLSMLGLTAAAVTSYGQGSIAFNTYNANNSNGIITTFGAGTGVGNVGVGINSSFTGELLWSTVNLGDGATTGPIVQGTALTAGWNVGVVGTFNTGSAAGVGGLGYITGSNLNIASAVGQNLFFEIVAFTGPSYASTAGGFAGHSAVFSGTLVTGNTTPDANQLNNMAPFSVFLVTPVPEPTTLALAGLGGLASLVMLRRKNA